MAAFGPLGHSCWLLLRLGFAAARPPASTGRYGLSLRRFHPQSEEYGRAFTIPNFALFGRPLENLSVRVHCINRLILTQIGYQGHFGSVAY